MLSLIKFKEMSMIRMRMPAIHLRPLAVAEKTLRLASGVRSSGETSSKKIEAAKNYFWLEFQFFSATEFLPPIPAL